MAQCCASMAQCYQASICGSMLHIRHQYGCASCINLAQYYASCINMPQFRSIICIMHQNYGPILCTMAQCCASTAYRYASGISMARYALGINVAVHASIILWLNAVHPCAMMCIRHRYGLMLCIRHQYGSIWLNAVHQASLWHNNAVTAQTCASCISKARCHASMTQAVHHTSIWLNTE